MLYSAAFTHMWTSNSDRAMGKQIFKLKKLILMTGSSL